MCVDTMTISRIIFQICTDYAPLMGKYKSRKLSTNEKRKRNKVKRSESLKTFNPFSRNVSILRKEQISVEPRAFTEQE